MSSRGYCLFCLEFVQPVDSLDTTKTFIKFLERFAQVDVLGNLLEELNLSKIPPILVLDCCELCQQTVDEFCEVYHQIKCLEIQLDLKLNKLVDNIELTDSDKVSSKWKRSDDLLENIFYNDSENKGKCQRMIRQFREHIKIGRDKLTKSQSLALANRTAKKHKTDGQSSVVQNVTQPIDEEVKCNDNLINAANCTGSSIQPKLEHDNISDDQEPDFFLDGQQSIPEMETSSPPEDDNLASKSVQEESLENNDSPSDADIKCVQCGKTFNSKKALHRHTSYVHTERTLKCPSCEKMYHTQTQLYQHMESHKSSEDWKWQCRKCDKKFLNQRNVNKHMKSHGTPQYNPPKSNLVKKVSVGSSSSSLKNKAEHLNSAVDMDKVKCVECGRGFRSEIALKMHTGNSHSKKRFSCPYCGKKYDIESLFNEHVELCKNPDDWKWNCTECGKKYMYESKLIKHMKTHTKDKS